jgi:predicted nucleotidyltransferase component of viral defense system
MINKLELKEYAKFMGYDIGKQEKHYLQNLILSILSDFPLIFKGGTYLWFFQGLQRFSEDLDFTVNGDVPKNLEKIIIDRLKYYGIKASVNKKKILDIGLTFRIDAEGPLYNGDQKTKCFVYVDISKREKVFETVNFSLLNDVYNVPLKNILCMGLEEVSAEKVRAILTRNKPRDIYDLYYLISVKKIKFNKKLIEEKLKYYNETFNKTLFLERLNKMKKDYKKELEYLIKGELPKFELVLNIIEKWLD